MNQGTGREYYKGHSSVSEEGIKEQESGIQVSIKESAHIESSSIHMMQGQ